MATTVAEHNVVLLAPSGKEQVVILRITRAGIQLATAQENRVRTHSCQLKPHIAALQKGGNANWAASLFRGSWMGHASFLPIFLEHRTSTSFPTRSSRNGCLHPCGAGTLAQMIVWTYRLKRTEAPGTSGCDVPAPRPCAKSSQSSRIQSWCVFHACTPQLNLFQNKHLLSLL
jgi:hypothetical protein